MKNQTNKTRIFFDMDGVLARFYDHVNYLERMWEKNFFYLLEPYTNTVDLVNACMSEFGDVDIYILSACNKDSSAMEEKKAWVDLFLPLIPAERRIFCWVGENKADYVPGGIRPNDFLIDDYTLNLLKWQSSGGVGIKFLNNVNGKGLIGPKWNGDAISYDDTVYANITAIKKIIGKD